MEPRNRKARIRRGLGLLTLALAALGVVLLVDPSEAHRSASFEQACFHLRRAIEGDRAALSAALEAFRRAVGGPFSGYAPHLGLSVVRSLEAEARGEPIQDAAVRALARGAYAESERQFRLRGGAAAATGIRLVQGVLGARRRGVGANDRGD